MARMLVTRPFEQIAWLIMEIQTKQSPRVFVLISREDEAARQDDVMRPPRPRSDGNHAIEMQEQGRGTRWIKDAHRVAIGSIIIIACAFLIIGILRRA